VADEIKEDIVSDGTSSGERIILSFAEREAGRRAML